MNTWCGKKTKKLVDSSRLNTKPPFSFFFFHFLSALCCSWVGFGVDSPFNDVVHPRRTSVDRRPLTSSPSLVAVADVMSRSTEKLCFVFFWVL